MEHLDRRCVMRTRPPCYGKDQCGKIRALSITRPLQRSTSRMDAGSCNACNATGTPLMKLSLGKDFFGRTYDRLSPASDQSPEVVLRSLLDDETPATRFSRHPRRVRQTRRKAGIRPVGARSETTRPVAPPGDCRHRGHAAAGSPLLNVADVKQLIERFHTRT